MKEKIYKYLVENDRKVSTQQIIEKFFHVYDHYPSQMEIIVESMLKDDPRFVHDEIGEWHVQKKHEKENLIDVVFSIVEIEAIPVDSKREIPVLLGIARLKNMKLISQQIFSLDIAAEYSPQLKQRIDNLLADQSPDHIFNQNAEEIYRNLDKTIVMSYAPSKVMTIINYFFRNQIGLELETETISMVNLARKVIRGIKIKSIEDIANSLSISFHSPLDLNNRLNLLAEILFMFLQEFKQLNIKTLTELKEFIERTKVWVDFSNYNFNNDYVKNLPQKPGVYLMKDIQGQIFYVGKAKDLKARVESYFVNRIEMDEKGKTILERIFDLDYEQVGSELEALLLENRYINEFQPDLNTQLKIHPLDISKYKTKQIILFLPGITEHESVLFFVNGIGNMVRATINRRKPNWQALKREVKHFFFDPPNKKSSFSIDQIEILWRWF
ncbi:MAG: nucleotide excision repair endonuclease, partial [bacterium]